MYDLVEQIRDDHISIFKVLSVMERQLEELNENCDPKYGLLVECMRYMIEYTDLVHHPKEDAMMRCVSAISSDLNALIEEITNQHKTIGKLSTEFYELVKAAEHKESIERKQISELGQQYISMQRAHVNLEEGHLLKDIRAFLLHEDYLQIHRQYENYRDPLLSDSFEAEYSALYHSIFSETP